MQRKFQATEPSNFSKASFERTLNKMSEDLQKFSGLNNGGCGVVAYYTAVYFYVPRIIYLNRCPERNKFIIDGMNGGENTAPAHAMVRISDGKCFDANGIVKLYDAKKPYGGRNCPVFNDKELTVEKLHSLYYNDKHFQIESNNLDYLSRIIHDSSLWNKDFDRNQIPDIKNLIMSYARSFFRLHT